MATIVSIHSFRSGTGKSNTTANLATLLAVEGRRVGVIDTDIQSPGIHVLFGLAGAQIVASLNDFLWRGRAIEDAARDVTPNLGDGASPGRVFLIPSSIKPGEITRVLREGYDAQRLTHVSLLSREQLLGGLPARRASTLLFAIESRTAHLMVRTRQAAARLATERSAEQQERAFLKALVQGRELSVQPKIQDRERYADEWASLVPDDRGVRAALATLLGHKYVFTSRDVPALRHALGLDDEAIAQACARLYGRPLQAIFAARSTWPRRLRWGQARLAHRLETLPPFWTVFALTLTEIVGAGILALPIAVAGVGALGGVALVLGLERVNVLTIAALSEAFTRDGNVRYGHTYFGRLVADYLGSNRSPALTRALLALVSLLVLTYCVGCLLAFYIGVSSTLGDVIGVPAPVWALLHLAAGSILFRLPGTVARELKVWVHQITPEGDSLGLAAEVEVGSGPDGYRSGIALNASF